jgi:hypothetical protein
MCAITVRERDSIDSIDAIIHAFAARCRGGDARTSGNRIGMTLARSEVPRHFTQEDTMVQIPGRNAALKPHGPSLSPTIQP